MNANTVPHLSHFGIFVEDIDVMTKFYTKVFGLRVTDQGVGHNFKYQLHFLSSSPSQHHQLVLAAGRAPGTPSSVMQMSFKVQSLDDLRRVRALALEHGASAMRGMNHGNALSIYFSDPEANTVEVYLDTPWYVPQPHRRGVPGHAVVRPATARRPVGSRACRRADLGGDRACLPGRPRFHDGRRMGREMAFVIGECRKIEPTSLACGGMKR